MITTPPPLTATLDNKQLQPAALPLPCTLHPLLQIQKQPRHPRPAPGPAAVSSYPPAHSIFIDHCRIESNLFVTKRKRLLSSIVVSP